MKQIFEYRAIARLRQGESIGRPIGSADFLTRIETLTARPLRARKRAPKPAQNAQAEN